MLAAWSGEIFRCMKNSGVNHCARWQNCWSHLKQELSFTLQMFSCDSRITWWLISPLHRHKKFQSDPVKKSTCTVNQGGEQTAWGGYAVSMFGGFLACWGKPWANRINLKLMLLWLEVGLETSWGPFWLIICDSKTHLLLINPLCRTICVSAFEICCSEKSE